MVKITITNLSSKLGRKVNIPAETDIDLSNKGLTDVAINFGNFKALKSLNLSKNRLQFARQLTGIFEAPQLRELDLRGNIIVKQMNGYRAYVIAHCGPALTVLDGDEVSDEERAEAWIAHPDCNPFADSKQTMLGVTDGMREAYKLATQSKEDAALAAEAAEKLAVEDAKKAEIQKKEDIAARRLEIKRQKEEEDRKKAEKAAEEQRLIAEARAEELARARQAGLVEDDEAKKRLNALESEKAAAEAAAAEAVAIETVAATNSVPAAKAAASTGKATKRGINHDGDNDDDDGGLLALVSEVNDEDRDIFDVDKSKAKAGASSLFSTGTKSLFGNDTSLFGDEGDDFDDDDDLFGGAKVKSKSPAAPKAAARASDVPDSKEKATPKAKASGAVSKPKAKPKLDDDLFSMLDNETTTQGGGDSLFDVDIASYIEQSSSKKTKTKSLFDD